jgi:hypothetical protein
MVVRVQNADGMAPEAAAALLSRATWKLVNPSFVDVSHMLHVGPPTACFDGGRPVVRLAMAVESVRVIKRPPPAARAQSHLQLHMHLGAGCWRWALNGSTARG